ncbi:hypothetical protein [Pseudomonas sp. GD03944]|uniref:hypothetical protein n=1 Tax=Pseudomonas sp. GD03944 TaxID=2975409 RepID=UPI00244A0400|nr:hypothetical protein [Pseudomonas sp. GD03944]MDH1263363.1 hypothetical protein [Pseudomonas sp. GD03944]
MSVNELVQVESKSPAVVASDLLSVIKDIELSIEDSSRQVSRIENRGLFKRAFSSSHSDLVDISRSQNKINEMMLGLIQEIITLNTMSYSFLAAVIGELEQRAKTGWLDSEGRFQELSETGQQFADRAHDIFSKILDGSKSTQTKIEVNQQNIEQLQLQFSAKAQVVIRNSEAIDDIRSTLSTKAELMARSREDIGQIQSVLQAKAERLSGIDKALEQKRSIVEQQDRAIKALVEELQENNRLDIAREQAMAALQQEVRGLTERLSALDASTITQQGKTKMVLGVLSGAVLASVIATVLNVFGLI